MKGKNYPERLKRLGLPTLEYRRERADMVEVYKIMNDIDLANMDKLFSNGYLSSHTWTSIKETFTA